MNSTHTTESILTSLNSSTTRTSQSAIIVLEATTGSSSKSWSNWSTTSLVAYQKSTSLIGPFFGVGVIICSVLVLIVIFVGIRRKRRAKTKFNNTAATYTAGACNGVPKKYNDVTKHSETDETTNNTSDAVVIKKDKSLDWNKILRFLARNIHAESWPMFFDCLYGYTELPKNLNFRERTRRVELDVRSRSQGSEYLILEQFKAWKEAAGNTASIESIKDTLTDLGHMDTLETFNTYMSDPPYLTGIDEPLESIVETQSSNVSQSNLCAMPFSLPPGSTLITETYRSMKFEVLQKERNEPDGANGSNSDVTINIGPQSGPSKSRLSHHDSDQKCKSLTGLTKCDNKFQQNHREPQSRCYSKTKQLKRLNAEKGRQASMCVRKGVLKRKKKLSECLTRKSFELLMASYFETNQEIKPDMHIIYTKHTIYELVKSGIQKGAARRLKYKEYSEIERICTKRGEDFHCLYIEDKPYFLNSNTHNKLKLYADHARSNVLHRLQNTNEEANTYMFIDFNGIPIFQRSKEATEDD